MGYPQEVSLKVLWRSDLIWQRYLGSKNVYLFVCLFIDLFFYFNNLGTPTESYPDFFMMIWLDLAEIFRISKIKKILAWWRREVKKGRTKGILLCNGSVKDLLQKRLFIMAKGSSQVYFKMVLKPFYVDQWLHHYLKSKIGQIYASIPLPKAPFQNPNLISF